MTRTLEQLARDIRRESNSKIERLARWMSRDDLDIEGIADERLNAWASWNGRGAPDGPGQPQCTLGKIMEERVAAGQRGSTVAVPAGVEETERVVLTLEPKEKRIVTVHYCEYSTMDQKAKDCGLSRSGFWRALRRIQRLVYMELY